MPTGAQRDGAGGPRSPSGWRSCSASRSSPTGSPSAPALVALVAGAALELAALPFAVAGWRASVAAGLSRQTLRGWLIDRAKGLALGAVLRAARPPSS